MSRTHHRGRHGLPDRAISVRAPWWRAILYHGKDIENRPRAWRYEGRVWLHASAWWSLNSVQDDWQTVRACYREAGGQPGDTGITWGDIKEACGSIVGSVRLCGTVEQSESPWFFGPYGVVLADPIPLAQPVPCKGALGLFKIPDDVRGALSHVA